MEPTLNFYELLEVPRSATPDEIVDAYRKAAMQWHPDRHRDNKELAEAKFKAIKAAFECLSDPARRARYDGVGWDTPSVPGIEQIAARELIAMFQMATGAGASAPLAFIRRHIDMYRTSLMEEETLADAEVLRVQGPRGLVRIRKEGVENLFDGVLQAQLEQLKEKKEELARRLLVLREVEKQLEAYEDVMPTPQAPQAPHYNILTKSYTGQFPR